MSEPMEKKAAWAAVVGLDWADRKHLVCLRAEGGQGPAELSVLEQKPEALEAWAADLLKRFGGGKILVCLEQSQGALINALIVHAFLEFCTPNPKSVARFREVFRPSMAKDDPKDAWLLCELARKHGESLRLWKPASAGMRLLTRLTWRRRRAVEERTRLELQLQAELKLAYPLVLELFADGLCLPIVVSFLQKWPSHEELKKASRAQLRRFFYAQNCRSEKKMTGRLDRIQTARALTEDRAAVQSGRLTILDLARRMAAANQGIEDYEEAITQEMVRHTDAKIFESLPGAGAALAPRLLVAFGEDRQRFGSLQGAEQHFGVAPIRVQSGQSCGVRFRRGCSKFLRQTFHEFAGCSVFWCEWARNYVAAKKKNGHGHQQALRALAFKWIRIIYRMWQEGSVYDEGRIVQALREKGSPYAPPEKKTVDG